VSLGLRPDQVAPRLTRLKQTPSKHRIKAHRCWSKTRPRAVVAPAKRREDEASQPSQEGKGRLCSLGAAGAKDGKKAIRGTKPLLPLADFKFSVIKRSVPWDTMPQPLDRAPSAGASSLISDAGFPCPLPSRQPSPSASKGWVNKCTRSPRPGGIRATAGTGRLSREEGEGCLSPLRMYAQGCAWARAATVLCPPAPSAAPAGISRSTASLCSSIGQFSGRMWEKPQNWRDQRARTKGGPQKPLQAQQSAGGSHFVSCEAQASEAAPWIRGTGVVPRTRPSAKPLSPRARPVPAAPGDRAR